MRRWFLGLETELLRVRFKELFCSDREEFFNYYKDEFDFNIVNREDCEVIVCVALVMSLGYCVAVLVDSPATELLPR